MCVCVHDVCTHMHVHVGAWYVCAWYVYACVCLCVHVYAQGAGALPIPQVCTLPFHKEASHADADVDEEGRELRCPEEGQQGLTDAERQVRSRRVRGGLEPQRAALPQPPHQVLMY